MSREWREWIIWPIAIGAMLAGAFGIFAGLNWSFTGHEFAERLGEALFIAGFLSITVDQYAKKRMLQEVSSDASKYLIGYGLPPEAQDRIKELMGCKLIRENYTAHYQATPSNVPGKLRLEVTVSYDVSNVTNHDELYQQHLELESHNSPVIIELNCTSSDPRSTYTLKGRDIFNVRDGLVEASGPPIRIKPTKAREQFTYRISDRHSVVQPEAYGDLISFLAPTINVTITADFPSEFNFIASAGQRSESTSPNTWEYRRLFMPSEHIRVRWSRRRSS